jgi:hypothetical protein
LNFYFLNGISGFVFISTISFDFFWSSSSSSSSSSTSLQYLLGLAPAS